MQKQNTHQTTPTRYMAMHDFNSPHTIYIYK